MCAKSLQSCLTLCDPIDCSPPGSSVHGILQVRIPEWVAMLSSRGSSRSRNHPRLLHLLYWHIHWHYLKFISTFYYQISVYFSYQNISKLLSTRHGFWPSWILFLHPWSPISEPEQNILASFDLWEVILHRCPCWWKSYRGLET